MISDNKTENTPDEPSNPIDNSSIISEGILYRKMPSIVRILPSEEDPKNLIIYQGVTTILANEGRFSKSILRVQSEMEVNLRDLSLHFQIDPKFANEPVCTYFCIQNYKQAFFRHFKDMEPCSFRTKDQYSEGEIDKATIQINFQGGRTLDLAVIYTESSITVEKVGSKIFSLGKRVSAIGAVFECFEMMFDSWVKKVNGDNKEDQDLEY